VGARFSVPVQTGPGTHPASCTMGNGSFPVVKRPGRDVDHPLPSSVEVKESVQLYLYSLFGPSWPVRRWTLPVPLPLRLTYPNSASEKQEKIWFLVNDQRDAQFFYVFIYIFNSLHVSSTSCSSSGETNCVNTTSGSCRLQCRVQVGSFTSDLHTTRPPT